MDIEVLRWFQSVAAGATVTDTARDAHVTQPAVSRALGRLQREVGTQLLYPAGRSLRPTPAGRLFHEHVESVLTGLDVGVRAVRELVDADHGVIGLAFLHTLGTWLVPPLVSSFRDAHPRARFDLRQNSATAMLAALRDGTVDLILTSPRPSQEGVRWRPLLTEPLRLVVPEGHALADRARVRLGDVAGDAFVFLRRGYGLREITERLCERAGFTPRVAFEGEEVETVRGLVRAGLGVALLPLPHLETARGSAARFAVPHLQLDDPGCERSIGVAWAADRPLPPAAERFQAHMIRETPRLLAQAT